MKVIIAVTNKAQKKILRLQRHAGMSLSIRQLELILKAIHYTIVNTKGFRSHQQSGRRFKEYKMGGENKYLKQNIGYRGMEERRSEGRSRWMGRRRKMNKRE